MAKVYNMQSPRSGRPVANQFIIAEEGHGANGNFISREVFQSYQTCIAERITWQDRTDITLDAAWDYSNTTRKYLYRFLGIDRKQVTAWIKTGKIKLANLN